MRRELSLARCVSRSLAGFVRQETALAHHLGYEKGDADIGVMRRFDLAREFLLDNIDVGRNR